MSIWSTIAAMAGVVFVYMTLVFALAMAIKRNDIVDTAWGIGFVIIAIGSGVASGPMTSRKWLVLVLVAAWGLRLALHVFRRNWAKPEDARYRKWREDWGQHFVVRSYGQIFMLQGLLMLIVSLPIMIVNATDRGGFGVIDLAGLAIWLTGFAFEAIGDYQLSAFKSDPQNKGKLMSRGLWRYTRHPNYFGEVALWWGVYVISLSAPMGWIGFLGPIAISYLILHVSGIPMLEKSFETRAGWQEYKSRTSPFFPVAPQKGSVGCPSRFSDRSAARWPPPCQPNDQEH